MKKANEFDTDSTDDGLLYWFFCTGNQLVVNAGDEDKYKLSMGCLINHTSTLIMSILSQSIMT